MLDGFVHPDFWPVALALSRQLGSYAGGAACCVYHRGEPVVDIWGGARNEQGEPWLKDTMALCFSTTKGVASTLLHILADRGLVDYDQPVARYWPAFAQNGKETLTVRHVLTHQAGLFGIRQMIDRAERLLDWDYMTHALERARPAHEPGAQTGYHAFTYGFLVGEICRRVTGTPFSELVRDEIARPLGLDGLYVGAPEAELHRAARLVWPDALKSRAKSGAGKKNRSRKSLERRGRLAQKLFDILAIPIDLTRIYDALLPPGIGHFDFSAPEVLRACIPSANGLFTARSLARLYACLAGGGELDGVRLLSKATIEAATEIQVHERDTVVPVKMRWRLGYHMVGTTRGIPKRAFGHFGFGGSGAWAHPGRSLSCALVVNAGMGTPFGDLRTVRISGAALTCALRREGGQRRKAV